MSVVKSQRKASQFEVFHHFEKMRKEITDLLLRDFGFDLERATKQLLKRYFGGKSYEELTPEEKDRFDKTYKKYIGFEEWFVVNERTAIVDALRQITMEIYVANSIYPIYYEELVERRVHQDKAIGLCFGLTQELQYAIETLPVDVNKYLRFAGMIQEEINLLKGWRKSDNRFKRVVSDTATNFANVNNNGNANNNNASNSYGVRPDFDSTIK